MHIASLDFLGERIKNADNRRHWRVETRRFRADAAANFTPSVGQRIEMAKFYKKALHLMPENIDGQPPLPVPAVGPVTLDELLGE